MVQNNCSADHHDIAGAGILREEVIGVDNRNAFMQREPAMLYLA
jgi:hypothetical protein